MGDGSIGAAEIELTTELEGSSVPIDAFAPKLQPPPARAGDVPRDALVQRLLDHDAESVVAVVAPPGYGKTTVLAQWSARQHREVAWISLDDGDNDPSALLADTAMAMIRAGVADPAVVGLLGSRADTALTGLARLTPALTSVTRSMALVLDQMETVDNPASLDVINELSTCLPPGSVLAVGARTLPPLPTALLRSHGDVVEIGVDELRMDIDEAALLLERAGARVDAADVAGLVEQTEGWPVGLYLAALAARTGGRSPDGRFGLRGDDRLIGDYLRSEILSNLDPATVEFLTRTAILDHLSGPLCDAMLDRRGSQATLEALESSNLLLVPLDRHREWYRYHRLFRELLAAELRHNEADLVPVLHGRAADWLFANRMPVSAIGHAQQAAHPERVAHLVTIAAQPEYAAGRATTVRGWFEWFRTEGLIESHPNIAVLGALVEALSGHPAAAERWQAAASADGYDALLPDGSPIEAWLVYLRALTGREGTEQMRRNARAASEKLAPASPFRAGALLLEGIGHVVEGAYHTADPILARACDVGEYVGASTAAAAACAERALVAIAADDWVLATQFAERGAGVVDDHRLDEYVEAAPVHIAVARVAIHVGDLETAKARVTAAARLRPLMTYAIPCTAQFQLELARTYLQLGDMSGARTLLRDLRDNLNQQTGMGALLHDADEVTAAVDLAHQFSIGASTLTVAELRVLPYLSTHLSFREIGTRLHVSHHTVKTQAIAIYRKLGASSRSEAIERAWATGLLAR